MKLVVGAVPCESAHRDRTAGLRTYADAGVPHCCCIEDEDGAPVVHDYELDEPTGAYAPAGVFRGILQRPLPSSISLDLNRLTPPRHSRKVSTTTQKGSDSPKSHPF